VSYAPEESPVVIGALAAGAWLTVHIDDEGIGVPEADRPLVAEPFHRAWNVREARIPGTGLGPYICRRLVEAHGVFIALGARAIWPLSLRVAFPMPLLASPRERR